MMCRPPACDDFFVFLVDIRSYLADGVPPLVGCRLRRIDLALAQNVASEKVRISAQQNVRSAARHVGGDRHGALAARLRHDFGFLLVILRVQDDVLDAGALQHAY